MVEQKFLSQLEKHYKYYLESIEIPSTIPGPLQPQLLWKITSKNHFDQITSAEYYDQANQVIYTAYNSYDENGLAKERQISQVAGSSTPVMDFVYNFNPNNGNLIRRKDSLKGLDEYFKYDLHDRLDTVTNNTSSPIVSGLHLGYDAVGNILLKSDLSSSAHPWTYNRYAVTKVPDDIDCQNTNVGPVLLSSARQANDQSITYYPFKKVESITEGQNNIQIEYGPDEERWKAIYLNTSTFAQQDRYYAENYEVTFDGQNATIEQEVSYIWGGNELVGIVYKNNGLNSQNVPQSSVFYLGTDHLGSITHIFSSQSSSPNGGIVEERSFDAWGRLRNPSTWQPLTASSAPNWMIDRGYTGHEHIWLNGGYDNNIINMNGRLYDPLLGRMYSTDPHVSDNTNSDCFNKYSYVNNNPLKYTDPTGEIIPLIVFGALAGAMMNYGMNAYHGQSFNQGLGNALIGAVAGAGAAGVGIGVSAVVVGGGFLTGAAAGAAAGFAGGFTTAAGNTWASGGTLGEGVYAGIVSGGVGAGISGVAGGLITGLYAHKYGYDFFTGSKVNEVVGEEVTVENTIAVKNARDYNKSQIANTDTDVLKYRMETELDFREGKFGVTKISTKVPAGYGFSRDAEYINLKGNYTVHAVTQNYISGMSRIHVSKAVAVYGTPADFQALAGHEVVHAYMNFHFNAGPMDGHLTDISEKAAYLHTVRTYLRYGDVTKALKFQQIAAKNGWW